MVITVILVALLYCGVAQAADLPPIEISEGVTPPRLIALPDVAYPVGAKKDGVEGNVLVRFVVDAKGKVRTPHVVSSPDERLTNSALASLKLRKYEPARKDGKPVSVWTKAQIGFRVSSEAEWLERHCDASGFEDVPPVEGDPGVVAARKLREVRVKTPEVSLTRPNEPHGADMECVIDVCGAPTRCRVVATDDEDWGNRCLEAAREERWRPARKNGEAVPSYFRWHCTLAGR